MNQVPPIIDFQLSKNQPSLKKKLEYVIKTFNEVYSIAKKTTIVYGKTRDNAVVILPANAEDFFERKIAIPDNRCTSQWEGEEIPFLFQDAINNPIIKIGSNRSVMITADILLNAFYFLSCWQEFTQSDQDKMGRFPYKSSLTNELEIAKIPVVNYYFDILKKAIQEFHGNEAVVSYRQREGLKVGLTHDVDQCTTGWKEDNLRLIKDGKLFAGISNIITRSVRDDIWFNFSSIIENEKRNSINSSFYFIAENQRSGRYPNADYRLESLTIQKQMNELVLEGFEVGIHGSIGAGFDHDKLIAEIQKFQFDDLGGRLHYLMMRIPETWKTVEKSGLLYDSTLGFAEMIGFRNGFCYPFQPYDFENETHYSFWEYPMNVMDKTLMQPEYLHLHPTEALLEVQTLIDEIQKWEGYFILNWHNNTLSGYKYRDWVNVYHEIINYCLKVDGSISSIMDHHKKMNKQ